MNFNGTEDYVATDELQMAVNAAIKLQKPLLIKGEPGTGDILQAVTQMRKITQQIRLLQGLGSEELMAAAKDSYKYS